MNVDQVTDGGRKQNAVVEGSTYTLQVQVQLQRGGASQTWTIQRVLLKFFLSCCFFLANLTIVLGDQLGMNAF